MSDGSPLRFVLVMPFANEHGGLEQYAVDLVERAAGRGWRTTVVAPHEVAPASWFRRSLGDSAWVAASEVPPPDRSAQERADERFWKGTGRQVLADADLIHLLGKPKSFIRTAARAAKKASVPSVYTEVAQVTAAYAGGSDLRPFRDSCNDIDLITVYCEQAASDVRERFGYRGPIRVVDQWLGLELEQRLLAIERPRPVDGEVVIGSLSRLGAEKGLVWLVEAYARLRAETDVPTRLVIAGTGPEHDRVAEAIAAADLTAHVDLAGYVDDKAALLPAIDVFVVSSEVEGGPISAVEAMAAGCTVASTRVGAMAERLEGCADGVLVDHGDTAAMAAALDQLARRVQRSEADLSLRRRFVDAHVCAVLQPKMDAVWDELLSTDRSVKPRRGLGMLRRARP